MTLTATVRGWFTTDGPRELPYLPDDWPHAVTTHPAPFVEVDPQQYGPSWTDDQMSDYMEIDAPIVTCADHDDETVKACARCRYDAEQLMERATGNDRSALDQTLHEAKLLAASPYVSAHRLRLYLLAREQLPDHPAHTFTGNPEVGSFVRIGETGRTVYEVVGYGRSHAGRTIARLRSVDNGEAIRTVRPDHLVQEPKGGGEGEASGPPTGEDQASEV